MVVRGAFGVISTGASRSFRLTILPLIFARAESSLFANATYLGFLLSAPLRHMGNMRRKSRRVRRLTASQRQDQLRQLLA